MARLDPHSFNDDTQPATKSLALKLRVDFGAKTLSGEAALTFHAPGEGALDLDTRGLTVEQVESLSGGTLKWKLHPEDEVLGARLEVTLPPGTAGVRVRYRTSPDASALQWLEPAQTLGGVHPYLFTQCQPIHARSIAPLQDTPRLRISWSAELTVPRPLTAVMAAAPGERTDAGDGAVFRFAMPQPIPPYLFAFAVGDLASRDLSPRCRVWAEPKQVDACANEFADVEQMISAAESLFGPYGWERFDLLTMPPSFPYGGMENPRLTFLTPTIIAGDRSLVDVVAHELAHSWTGNLVTNANAEHFWLNEGFTVWAERRIVEVLQGEEVAALEAALGRRTLDDAVKRFADRPELTKLKTDLTGVHPDDAYSEVPYEKGYLFLALLEATAGRAAFDAMTRQWLAKYAFQSVTTAQFLEHVEATLPGLLEKVNAEEWVNGAGVPANAPAAKSKRLEAIEAVGAAVPEEAVCAGWKPLEWRIYLDRLPKPSPLPLLEALDGAHRFTESANHEVLATWLNVALRSGYAKAVDRAEAVLKRVGRMKYLKPLYAALLDSPETRERARAVYAQAKASYHPIARQVVESLFAKAGV